jgi:hypothetical protein
LFREIWGWVLLLAVAGVAYAISPLTTPVEWYSYFGFGWGCIALLVGMAVIRHRRGDATERATIRRALQMAAVVVATIAYSGSGFGGIDPERMGYEIKMLSDGPLPEIRWGERCGSLASRRGIAQERNNLQLAAVVMATGSA